MYAAGPRRLGQTMVVGEGTREAERRVLDGAHDHGEFEGRACDFDLRLGPVQAPAPIGRPRMRGTISRRPIRAQINKRH